MIWSLELVYKVRSIRVRGALDEGRIYRDGEAALEAMRGALAKRVARMAETVAVDIDLQDVQFGEQDRALVPVRDFIAWWEPRTRKVELRGGPADGQAMELAQQLIFRPIYLPVERPIEIEWLADLSAPVSLSEKVEYVYAGWNESTRRWVYDFTRYC